MSFSKRQWFINGVLRSGAHSNVVTHDVNTTQEKEPRAAGARNKCQCCRRLLSN